MGNVGNYSRQSTGLLKVQVSMSHISIGRQNLTHRSMGNVMLVLVATLVRVQDYIKVVAKKNIHGANKNVFFDTP